VKPSTRTWIWASLTSILLYLIYGHLFRLDPLILYDDNLVIEPLQQVHSVGEYLKLFRAGTILDLQPVRDAVTAFNYYLLNHFSWSCFHLTNVVIWGLALLGLRSLLLLIGGATPLQIDLFTLILGANPLFVSSVAWVSARKHLLAAFFIIHATRSLILFLRSNRTREFVSFTLFYLLAVLSHPIILLWPFCAAFALYLMRQHSKLKALIPAFALSVLIYFANRYYYDTWFLRQSGNISKYAGPEYQNMGVRFLLIGRYFFQLLIPYWTSIGGYALDSIQNICGLALLPVFLILSIKGTGLKRTLICASAFLAFLLPVTLTVTPLIGNDTYLVSACLPMYYLLFSMASRRRMAWLLTALLPIFVLAASEKSLAWSSKVLVMEQAYRLEESRLNQANYSEALMTERRFKEAFWIASDTLTKYPNDPRATDTIISIILQDPEIDDAQKEKYIREYKLFSTYGLNSLARIAYNLGKFELADDIQNAILEAMPKSLLFDHPAEIAAFSFTFCVRAKRNPCLNRIDRIKNAFPKENWNETQFLNLLEDLNSKKDYLKSKP
jgi:hypothetical protein